MQTHVPHVHTNLCAHAPKHPHLQAQAGCSPRPMESEACWWTAAHTPDIRLPECCDLCVYACAHACACTTTDKRTSAHAREHALTNAQKHTHALAKRVTQPSSASASELEVLVQVCDLACAICHEQHGATLHVRFAASSMARACATLLVPFATSSMARACATEHEIHAIRIMQCAI